MKRINLFFLITLLFACNQANKVTNAETQKEAVKEESFTLTVEQLQMMHIELGEAERKNLQNTITANGKVTVLSDDIATVTPKIKGRVENIFVHEGQFVAKGQKLIALTCPDLIQYQQDYLQAKSELLFLEKERERQLNMQAQKVGALKDLQEVEAKYNLETTRMKSAEAKLKMSGVGIAHLQQIEKANFISNVNIIAPIGGYVTMVKATMGAGVSETDELVKIINLGNLHADVSIYEKDLAFVKENQTVLLNFISANTSPINGKIEYVGSEVDLQNRTIALHVPFVAPKGVKILPEMQVVATIKTNTIAQETLPESAVFKEDNKYYFFYEKENNKGVILFQKAYFTPSTFSDGFVGIKEVDANILQKRIAIKGAHILNGESKRGEMAE